jgi:hypothetical protein
MTSRSKTSLPEDENLIRFEIRDGMRRIGCTVMDDALEGVSGLDSPSTAILRRRAFDRFRTLINIAATDKIASLPAGSLGPICLTREDLMRVPAQTGMPVYGTIRTAVTRPS